MDIIWSVIVDVLYLLFYVIVNDYSYFVFDLREWRRQNGDGGGL